ncbi:MAG: 2-amino-4-hydroxy-6-hydroxymethyldihydropteridine diphosphokinase [bacterium]
MIHPWCIAYIGVGSNLGDKIKNCALAIQQLHTHPLCEVLRVSSFYETEPITKTPISAGGWYVNAAVKIRTRLNAVKLLQFLLDTEIQLGRDPLHEKWSPRPIDLDLLFFNDEIIKTAPLRVPHPELHKRRFVLEPLVEIAPDLVHPVKGKKIETLLHQLNDNNKVVPLFRFYLSRNAAESFGQT